MSESHMILVPLDQDTVAVLASLAQKYSQDTGERLTIENMVSIIIEEFLSNDLGALDERCDGNCNECIPDIPEKPPMVN